MNLIPNMKDIRAEFSRRLNNKEFILDKTDVKTIEILGITFIADEQVLFGEFNPVYAQKELDWYKSQSLNIWDMPKIPKIWKQVSSTAEGNINSNYGWVIYHKDNYNQYTHCLRALRRDKNTRRAMMIYTRPSMQIDYNKGGMSDFMCTNTAQLFIRENKLDYVVNQRSCDAIFGFKNDVFWHRYVHAEMLKDLAEDYPELTLGTMYYQVGSLHVYERHFDLIKIC